MNDEIKVPFPCTRNDCINEFGSIATSFYESRLREREMQGFIYRNIYKTIYIFAYKDRKTRQGFYSSFVSKNRSRYKNHGGS